MSDEDSFKMMLMILAGEWIMLSQHWCRDGKKMEKRDRQTDWVIRIISIYLWQNKMVVVVASFMLQP